MSSVKKNFMYQVFYQILIVILPLITSPYISRVLGTGGVGEYSYAYSIVYYFSLFVLLGVNNYGTRTIAKMSRDKISLSKSFFSIYVIQIFMGIVVGFIYILTQVVFSDHNVLAKIQLLYLLSAVLDVNWLFFGLEKFKVTVSRNCIIKVITVMLIFVFVNDKNDLPIYTLIMAASALVSQLVLWTFAVREIKVVKVTIEEIKCHIKPLIGLFLPVMASSIFVYMDKIMLGLICDKSELGLYENSEKIMSVPLGVITALGTIMLPRISNMLVNRENDKIRRYRDNSMLFSIIASAALAFGLSAISKEFAPWFWGADFEESGRLIQFISVNIIFISWADVVRTQYLLPNELENIFVRATVYGALINVVVNLMLIPSLGAFGTVIGTIAAQFVLTAYQNIRCRKVLPIKKYIKEAVPFWIIGMIMYLTVRMVAKVQINYGILIGLEIVSGGFVFLGLCLVYIYIIRKKTIKTFLI